MLLKFILTCCVVTSNTYGREENAFRKFPDNFLFGVASASYQVEGGWNASGKGENIWDRFTHTTKGVEDRSNGDIACDSYHKHKRDIEMLRELGVDFYRFSISWSRILPNGIANKVNEDGVRYYNELIDDLLAANITPSVTLYHWDLPQRLQDMGGWLNPLMVDYFADFAKIAFQAFGDRVKTWITFNEPWVECVQGYGGVDKAPALNMSGIGEYLCVHTILKAHAAAYHLYDDNFRPTQKGRLTILVNFNWQQQLSDADSDIKIRNRAIQFTVGWTSHPIFSKTGDYPKVMKDEIKRKSFEQGFPRSRLPEFTAEEIKYIKGTSDFFGVNHYSTFIIKPVTEKKDLITPSFDEDKDSIDYRDPNWPNSALWWLKVVPWGFRKMLNWVKDHYNNPEIIVFENGFCNYDGINDTDRISFLRDYLNSLLDAIEDGCNVTGYTVWSLMDSFEWLSGYTVKFGLYHVNFTDPERTRSPKSSAFYFKNIISTRTIEKRSGN